MGSLCSAPPARTGSATYVAEQHVYRLSKCSTDLEQGDERRIANPALDLGDVGTVYAGLEGQRFLGHGHGCTQRANTLPHLSQRIVVSRLSHPAQCCAGRD